MPIYLEVTVEVTEDSTELATEPEAPIVVSEAPIVVSEAPIVVSIELTSETTEDATEEITEEVSDEDFGAVQPANPIAARTTTAKIARNFFMV